MAKKDSNNKVRFSSIFIDETKYKTQLTWKYKMRKTWRKPDDNQLSAYIPGVVKQIFVKEGQKVKKGDKLLVFEAMKMNNRVHANKDALVKTLFVKIGDLFPRGTILVELEPIV
jgi:biotin carboxyl carrier protein